MRRPVLDMQFKITLVFTVIVLASDPSAAGVLETLEKGVKEVSRLVDRVFQPVDQKKSQIEKDEQREAPPPVNLTCLQSHANSLNQDAMYADCWQAFSKLPKPGSPQE